MKINKAPKIYFNSNGEYDFKSIDYGDYFRYITTKSNKKHSDELVSCVLYVTEGEKINY